MQNRGQKNKTSDDVLDIQEIKKKILELIQTSKEERLNQIQSLTHDQLAIYCRVTQNLKEEFFETENIGSNLIKQEAQQRRRVDPYAKIDIEATYDVYLFEGHGECYTKTNQISINMRPHLHIRDFNNFLTQLEHKKNKLETIERDLVKNLYLRSLIKNTDKNKDEVKTSDKEQAIQDIRELILADQEEKALNALLDRHTLVDRCQTLDAANKEKEEKIKQLVEEKDREIEKLKLLLESSHAEQGVLNQNIAILQQQLLEAGKMYEESKSEKMTLVLSQQDQSKKLQSIESELTEIKNQAVEISSQSLSDLLKEYQPKSVMSFFSLSADITYLNLKALLTKARKQVSISEIEACIRHDVQLLQIFQNPDLPCEKTEKTALIKDLAWCFKQAALRNANHNLLSSGAKSMA